MACCLGVVCCCLQVVFDPRSRTETNCDWVIFYKDQARTLKYGDRFHGRNGSENFPGFGRRPPLWIPSDRCVAHFHSDGSTVDWGIRFTAYGLLAAGGGGRDQQAEVGGSSSEEEARLSRQRDSRISLSCWLIDVFSRPRPGQEDNDEVARIVYHPHTLDTLRHALTLLSRCESGWGDGWVLRPAMALTTLVSLWLDGCG